MKAALMNKTMDNITCVIVFFTPFKEVFFTKKNKSNSQTIRGVFFFFIFKI